ncbi:MAG: hypothetical protein M3Q73_03000 [bacterium]|nr:hypothetical protein [bacterium]
MDQDDRELQQRFDEIPDELAAALISPDLNANILRIARNYNLPQEDVEHIQLLVSLIFFGEHHVNNFSNELEDMLDLPEDIVSNLAEDLYPVVFAPYLEDLVEVGNTYAGKTQREMEHEAGEDGETIQQHILNEIEHPTPSPMVSTPKVESAIPAHIPAPELQNLPTARVIPPLAPLSVPNYSPARELPKMVKKEEEPKAGPSSILMQQLEVPTHNLDHEPHFPEHDEDLMPLVIQTSRNVQLSQIQRTPAPAAPVETPAQAPVHAPTTGSAPTNTPGVEKRYTDPYREPIV